jgi:hypothetical protein
MSSDPQITFTKALSTVKLKYVLDQAIPEEKDYIGDVKCSVNNKIIYTTISPNIKQYKTQPFDVSESLVDITSSGVDYSFNVTNKIDDPISVIVEFKNPEVFFEFDNDQFVLSPGESKTVTVKNLATADVNVSSSNIIVVKSLDGVEKRITFSAEFMAMENSGFNFMIIVYVVLILLVLFFFMINFFLIFRKSIIKSASEKTKPKYKAIEKIIVGVINKILPEKFKLSLTDEVDEATKIIQNAAVVSQAQDDNVDYHVSDMVDIMRSLNKTDTLIRKELEQEGFTTKQIDDGLREADKLKAARDEKAKKKSTTRGQV